MQDEWGLTLNKQFVQICFYLRQSANQFAQYVCVILVVS